MDFSPTERRSDNIWKMKHAKSFKLDTTTTNTNTDQARNLISIKSSTKEAETKKEQQLDEDHYDFYEGHDLLESVERQLKQVLCISDLTARYRPHVLAFCILSHQIDELTSSNLITRRKYQNQNRTTKTTNSKSAQEIDKQTTLECTQAILDRYLATFSSVSENYEVSVSQCKQDVKFHLNELTKKSESSFDRFLQEYHCKVVNTFRTSVNNVPNESLMPSIVEERESEEEDSAAATANNNNRYQNNNNSYNHPERIVFNFSAGAVEQQKRKRNDDSTSF